MLHSSSWTRISESPPGIFPDRGLFWSGTVFVIRSGHSYSSSSDSHWKFITLTEYKNRICTSTNTAEYFQHDTHTDCRDSPVCPKHQHSRSNVGITFIETERRVHWWDSWRPASLSSPSLYRSTNAHQEVSPDLQGRRNTPVHGSPWIRVSQIEGFQFRVSKRKGWMWGGVICSFIKLIRSLGFVFL